MCRVALPLVAAAVFAAAAPTPSSAMPAKASGALTAPTAAASGAEKAQYYWDYPYPYGYHWPYGYYRPYFGYYNYYQTYGCSVPNQYCTYGWPTYDYW